MIRRLVAPVGQGQLAHILTRMLSGTMAESRLTCYEGPSAQLTTLDAIGAVVDSVVGAQRLLFRANTPINIEYIETQTQDCFALVLTQSMTGLAWCAFGTQDHIGLSQGPIVEGTGDFQLSTTGNGVWGSGLLNISDDDFATLKPTVTPRPKGGEVYDTSRDWVPSMLDAALGPLVNIERAAHTPTPVFGWWHKNMPEPPGYTPEDYTKAMLTAHLQRDYLQYLALGVTEHQPILLSWTSVYGLRFGVSLGHPNWYTGQPLSDDNYTGWWVLPAIPLQVFDNGLSVAGMQEQDHQVMQYRVRLALPAWDGAVQEYTV